MRVGVVTHYMPPHPGGIELVAAALVEAFTGAGHDVRWVASRVPRDAPAAEEGRIRVPCWNGPEDRLGVPWPVWGATAVRATRRLVAWADVVHVHDCLYPGSVLAAILAPRRRRPLLLSQHVGFVPYASAALNLVQRAAHASLGRAVLRRCDRIVPATPAAELHVRALVGDSPRVVAIPNGIDTERFRPATSDERRRARERHRLPPDGPVAVFVGRLVEKKGVPTVVAVAAGRRDVAFLLVGDGPLAPVVATAPPNVTWVRRVAPPDMPACYHAADVLVLPSHGEGLPLTVQEALASGLPAVVSESEAFARPLVEAGACAAAPPDAASVAGALDDALARSGPMGAAGRRIAERAWSRDAMATAYLALLDELVRARPARDGS